MRSGPDCDGGRWFTYGTPGFVTNSESSAERTRRRQAERKNERELRADSKEDPGGRK
jgi:hypothetical protein